MADAEWIAAVCVLFVYGFRLMARLDQSLSSRGKRGEWRFRCPESMPVPRRLLCMYFSGASLKDIARVISHA
ncbi:MAG: hypothetical protein J6U72_02675 [Clostridia bacterium]|nr:hypothetical protein [Clostridia bacterium]